MELLKERIAKSPDASPFCKKVFIWLLEKTEGKKAIMVSFPPCLNGYVDEALMGFHEMLSDGRKTRIAEFISSLGSSMIPSHHTGHFSNGSTDYSEPGGCTLWLSDASYDGCAEQLVLNLEEIESIILPK